MSLAVVNGQFIPRLQRSNWFLSVPKITGLYYGNRNAGHGAEFSLLTRSDHGLEYAERACFASDQDNSALKVRRKLLYTLPKQFPLTRSLPLDFALHPSHRDQMPVPSSRPCNANHCVMTWQV